MIEKKSVPATRRIVNESFLIRGQKTGFFAGFKGDFKRILTT
jgi:hypothetical protein